MLLDPHEHDLEGQRGVRGERGQRHELVEQREVAAARGRAATAANDAVLVDPQERRLDGDRVDDAHAVRCRASAASFARMLPKLPVWNSTSSSGRARSTT